MSREGTVSETWIAGRRLPVPKTIAGRAVLGSALIVGGILGFLPVLGFWMIPLGLLILSEDFAFARRLRRRAIVRIGRLFQR